MKLIAIEEHLLSPDVARAWASLPPQDQDPGLDLHSGELGSRLADLGAGRIELMDESGVDVQVLSLTTPAVQNLPRQQSVDLARETNDLIAAAVARRPDRLQGFACMPTPAPDRCADELRRCIRSLGLKGALLCGRTGDTNLDHPDYWPMFQAAADLGAPLFIHPQAPQRTVRETYYTGFSAEVDLAFSTYGLGWHYEAGIQFLRMILAGVFDRFPRLQIILGHWGEVVLFYLERIERIERVAGLQRSIRDCVRQNLYVTASGMFSAAYMRQAVEIVGVDRVLFSTDYPYQYRPGRQARNFLEACPLDDDAKRRFAHGNWDRLISGLPARQGRRSPRRLTPSSPPRDAGGH